MNLCTAYVEETMQRMQEDGLLLVTQGGDKKPNVMTIGWGTIGVVWSRPVFIVFVRPSRYTFDRLEDVAEFTVNVPPKALQEAVAHCGTVSGRQHDKIQDMKLTIRPSQHVSPPIIAECAIHYECRSLHQNDLAPATLFQPVMERYYPKQDFHRLYFGEILACYASKSM